MIKSPENFSYFDVFAKESIFARNWLETSINNLKETDEILEVGAGLMILSCQLVREGYLVTALEPISEGFSKFSTLQKVILEYARANGFSPKILECTIEQLDQNQIQKYDFAYSVNVMEHISNVEQGVVQIVEALKTGGVYRFTCPNYLFPYEPHFNIPTIFTKKLTEKLFKKRIYESARVDEPKELWSSINWINAYQLKKIVSNMPNVRVAFNKDMLSNSIERIQSDKAFASRRSAWVVGFARFLVYFNIHRIFAIFPVEINPILDCTIIKN